MSGIKLGHCADEQRWCSSADSPVSAVLTQQTQLTEQCLLSRLSSADSVGTAPAAGVGVVVEFVHCYASGHTQATAKVQR